MDKLREQFDDKFCQQIYDIYIKCGRFCCLPSFAAHAFCAFLDKKNEVYVFTIRQDNLIEVTEVNGVQDVQMVQIEGGNHNEK